MTGRSRRSGPLTLIIIGGILAGILFAWGGDIWAFLTGEDILQDLAEEIADTIAPTATPRLSAAPAQRDGQAASSQPLQDSASDQQVALAADGFPLEERQHVLRYTIQPGDALFLIAERFALSPDTIFWANYETLQDNVHLLRVGVELYILPVDGIYLQANGAQSIEEIAADYGVTPGDILYSPYNQLSNQDASYIVPEGLHILIPGGRRPYITWQAPIRTGSQQGDTNPEGNVHPGSCRESYTGTGGGGLYQNPLGDISYRVTNGFENWHPGVDLAAEFGTPIYAAEGGVVVFAGWHRDGYGELVIIDHGGGWTTYYGHLAERFVDCGDQVSKGQYIANMGMSGNATGVHLHFEIRQNDRPQNPYGYVAIRDVRNPGG